MSDIQDLIHKTSIDCIEKGRQMEQERIVKLLEKLIKEAEAEGNYLTGVFLNKWLPLIKGGNNE